MRIEERSESADRRLAHAAVDAWRDRPVRARIGTNELDDLVGEVEAAITIARARGEQEALTALQSTCGIQHPVTFAAMCRDSGLVQR